MAQALHNFHQKNKTPFTTVENTAALRFMLLLEQAATQI